MRRSCGSIPATGKVTDELRLVGHPGAETPAPIALTVAGSAVWVLNANTATVTRVDAASLAVAATIPIALESSPRDIEAGAGAVWVSSFDGTVTRLPTGRGRAAVDVPGRLAHRHRGLGLTGCGRRRSHSTSRWREETDRCDAQRSVLVAVGRRRGPRRMRRR